MRFNLTEPSNYAYIQNEGGEHDSPANEATEHVSSHFSMQVAYRSPEIIISSLLALVLVVLTIYTLALSNTDSVFQSCGQGLWIHLVVRLFIGVIIQLAVLVGASTLLACCGPLWTMVAAGISLFMVIVTLFVLGMYFSVQAIANNEGCKAALIAATPLNAPMLAVMGFIYASLDGLFLLIFMGGLCLGFCFFAEISS